MSEIPDILELKHYSMDPTTDDLLYTRELKDGMVVLIESSENRVDTMGDGSCAGMRQALKYNRWCKLTKLRNGVFIGKYFDGTKVSHSGAPDLGWYVKLDSMISSDDAKMNRQAIQHQVQNMLQQSMDQSDSGETTEDPSTMARNIVALF